MVVKLWGTCNGAEIICTHAEGERWETIVPSDVNGTYIIELWAEDEAGNRGYFATIKITYDPTKLCFSVEIIGVGAAFTVEEVIRVLAGDRFCTQFSIGAVNCALGSDPIQSKVVKCEVCGQ